MTEYSFWISITILIYIYFGYPALLQILSGFTTPQSFSNKDLPSVTVIIPAYNEIEFITATIKNKLSQNYPRNLLEIIVVSDESGDGTDDAVREITRTDSRVQLLVQKPRQGKTAGLNLAMTKAKGSIIVFSDANSLYSDDAIIELVRCFDDQSVGYVTGKMVYISTDGSLVGDGCSAYMKYENWIRSKETMTGSVVGVDGGIDAVRKDLYVPMRADQLPDFVQPLHIVTQKSRVVYCEKALVKEHALEDSTSEFKMRTRVSLRALWAIWDMRHLFNPLKYGFFSLQLLSHKLLRYLSFLPLIVCFLTNLLLIPDSPLYILTSFLQVFFYTSPILVKLNPKLRKPLGFMSYFILLHLAAAFAFAQFLSGKKIVTWKPRNG